MKALIFLSTLVPGLCLGVGLPEPETIFYGKVTNHSGSVPYQMQSGTLSWSVSREADDPLVFTVELRSLSNGEFSYSLPIPHSALALDLEVADGSIPLGATPSSHEHLTITVDGQPAAVADGAWLFDVEQATRASTYRLDLRVDYELPDTDGDGMADWWEDLYGLDKQINDAAGDLDGDGISNLAEFDDGTDPTKDGRIPALMTSGVNVYGDGTSGVFMETLDLDTAPSALVYTITTLPTTGELRLRDVVGNPSASDRVLIVGSTFSQAQLNEGRLIHVASGALGQSTVGVTVSDGDPEHEDAVGAIDVAVIHPDHPVLSSGTAIDRVDLALDPAPIGGASDETELRQFILTRDGGYVSWNLSDTERAVTVGSPGSGEDTALYSASYGSDSPVVMVGTDGDDELSGGLASDVLIGGPGDDQLRGDLGADRFVTTSTSDGDDQVLDFSVSQGDILDFSQVLSGASTDLGDYIELTSDAVDTVLALDVDGDGSGFTDGSVTLVGVTGVDLYGLWSSGLILTDGLILPPRVAIRAPSENASENGPTAASFVVELETPSATPVVIGLVVSGSATDGVDFAPINSTLTVPAGETEFLVPVTPYQDSITEPNETVRIDLQSGAGYDLGSAFSAELTIDDLLPEITVTALVPTASKQGGSSGLFLIERSGIIDRSVLVRLSLGGTATAGSDYDSILNFVNLASGDTSALIQVTPKAGADLSFGMESVVLNVTAHSSYRMGNPSDSEVMIVDEMETFVDWVSDHHPSQTGVDRVVFGEADQGSVGVPNLLRYAFLLNAQSPWRLPESGHLPRVTMLNGRPAIEFSRNLAAQDLEWIVEGSEDLSTWSSDPSVVEDLSDTVRDADARKALFRLVDPPGADEGASFLRVRVELKP